MTQDKSPRRNPLSHQNEHLLQQKKQQITYDLHTLSILAMVGSFPCRLLYVYINTHFTLYGIRLDPLNSQWRVFIKVEYCIRTLTRIDYMDQRIAK